MGHRTIFYMTAAVIIGMLVILAMNTSKAFDIFPAKYISPNDVRGMAVRHHNLLYTLNFEQQNALVDIFNHSTPLDPNVPIQNKSAAVPTFDAIILYRFKEPDIEIRPMGYVTSKQNGTEINLLVFNAPAWNLKGPLQQTTPEDFIRFISTTYDP